MNSSDTHHQARTSCPPREHRAHKTESRRMVVKLSKRQHEIGHRLRQNDEKRFDGRNQQDLHRPRLLLAHDGDGGHHGANQHQNKPHDTRHEVVGTLHLRIVQQLELGYDGSGMHFRQKHLPAGRSEEMNVCGIRTACIVAILGSVASETSCTRASPV